MPILRSSSQTDATFAFTLSHEGGSTEFKLDCPKPFNAEVDHFSLFWLGRPNHEYLSAFINQNRRSDLREPIGALFFFDHSKFRIRPRVVAEKMPSALEHATIAQYGGSASESLRFVRYEIYAASGDSDNPRDSRCAVWADLWGAVKSNITIRNTEVGVYATVPDFEAAPLRDATSELIEQTLDLPMQLINDYLSEVSVTLREGAR